MITKAGLFNIVLVHTARTWERIRLEQEFEEMPLDNIESTSAIVEIADKIIEDKILQELLVTNSEDWDWEEKTDTSFSDVYIEGLAEKIIKKNYLD
jgi:hypothetical protein